MKTSATIALFLLTAAFAFAAPAQPSAKPQPYYYFNSYQTADGLSSNTVFCSVQDKDNFIWVGTRDGICRYDGSSFVKMGDAPSRMAMAGVVEALLVDNEGLLWFSTAFGRGNYNPFTGEIVTVDIEDHTAVRNIIQDKGGDIWFCTDDLYRYSKTTKEINKYPSSDYFQFVSISSDSSGQVWCACSDGRVLRYDGLVDKFKEQPYSGLEKMIAISGNRILASTSDARVVVIDPQKCLSDTIYKAEVSLDGSNVTCLLEREPGEFWIGTPFGIYVYIEGQGVVGHIVHSDSERMSISSNYITDLFADNEGNVWAGTFYNGINLWRNSHSAFYLFYPLGTQGSISGKIVRAITISDQVVWVGTEDGELNSLNMGEPFFRHHEIPGVRNNYQDILVVGDEIWISTYGNGIFRYNPRTSKVIRHYTFADNHFLRQLRTSTGDILVGSTAGVYRYVPETDSFEKVPESGDIAVMALCEDSTGRLWFGTSGKGILLYDLSLNHIGNLGHLTRITSFFEDSSHRMWVTTEGGGLDSYDLETLTRTRKTRAQGLSSNITCAVAEDEEGMIWVASINGLQLLDPKDFHIVTSYFTGTQIEANMYMYGAVGKSSAGAIFLGTSGGLLSFTPSRMKTLEHKQPLFITDIIGIKNDKITELSTPGCSAAYSTRINTSYKEVASLSIRFISPIYSNIFSTKYQYRLSSRNGEINETTSTHRAMFSNIGYGKHEFTVSVVGSDDPSSTKTVEFYVKPPFVKSIFAKILFVALAIVILALIVLNIVKERMEKRRRNMAELEQAKQRELYESKNAFFTNITHEIRTPLSLIKMPLEQMLKSGKYSEKDLLAIQANTDRLLNLSNQLLDIRKLEQKEEKLEFTRQNICEIVLRASKWFIAPAEDQGIHLTISIPDEHIDAMCARDSVEKIVSNLISNAMKYGGGEIAVSLETSDDKVVVRVDSNGVRIPAEESTKIFDKFVHGGKGTGLGLPLAKTLAELHGGRLYLDIARKDVNSFVLELPLKQPESITLQQESSSAATDSEQEFDDAKRDVLIVEDNQDFRLYLAEALAAEYNVLTAPNGRVAVEKLATRKIDLIVSDIMMPVMDGCELCNYVKSTVEYSHIPVILLTAAVGTDTRIETLYAGADGYIEKPFSIELLMANIANVFKNREIAYRQFSTSPLSHFNGINTNRVDEELMTKLHSVVLDKMSESTLSIEDLASALNISTSTLFRKVKANTGMNISEYIRVSRLKRAAELLASRQYRVNEVADMVGFSSSTYFSTNFQKQFNISPSAFLKSL